MGEYSSRADGGLTKSSFCFCSQAGTHDTSVLHHHLGSGQAVPPSPTASRPAPLLPACSCCSFLNKTLPRRC